MIKWRGITLASFFLIVVSAICCGCGNSADLADTAVPIIPTAQPRPSFVVDLSPKESARIPSHLFLRSDGSKGERLFFPDPVYGYDSTVCVKVDVGPPLWQPGDNFASFPAVLEHITMIADGQVLTEIAGGSGPTTYIGVKRDLGTFPPPTPTPEWLTPYTICWKAELGVGVHAVTIRFRQTSSEVHEYSWYFAITEN